MTCAMCKRPEDPECWGMCRRCRERDLIRGAKVLWQAAAGRLHEARKGLAEVAHQAVIVAMSTESDRDKRLRAFRAVEGLAAECGRLAEESNRLHGEAVAKALDLWQLRGRTGKLALRIEDLPPEEPTL